MSNFIFFLLFVPILASILLLVNFLLAPHQPNKNKDSQFECGFSSFIQMSRLPFAISFFLFGLLFLLFDIEILLAFPYIVSSNINGIYGLITLIIFFTLLVFGFAFELGKKALEFNTKENKKILKSGVSSSIPRIIHRNSFNRINVRHFSTTNSPPLVNSTNSDRMFTDYIIQNITDLIANFVSQKQNIVINYSKNFWMGVQNSVRSFFDYISSINLNEWLRHLADLPQEIRPGPVFGPHIDIPAVVGAIIIGNIYLFIAMTKNANPQRGRIVDICASQYGVDEGQHPITLFYDRISWFGVGLHYVMYGNRIRYPGSLWVYIDAWYLPKVGYLMSHINDWRFDWNTIQNHPVWCRNQELLSYWYTFDNGSWYLWLPISTQAYDDHMNPNVDFRILSGGRIPTFKRYSDPTVVENPDTPVHLRGIIYMKVYVDTLYRPKKLHDQELDEDTLD